MLDIDTLNLQELGELYEHTDGALEDLKAQLIEVKKLFLTKWKLIARK